MNKEKLDNITHDLYKSDMRKKAEARGMKFKHIGEQHITYEDWADSFFEKGFDWKSEENKLKKGLKATTNAVTFIPRRSNLAHGTFLDLSLIHI